MPFKIKNRKSETPLQLSHQLMYYRSLDKRNNLRTQVINPQNHAMFAWYPTFGPTPFLTCWMLSQTCNFKRPSGETYFRQIALTSRAGAFLLFFFFVLCWLVGFKMLLRFWSKFLEMRKPMSFKNKNIEGNKFKS